MPTRTQLQQLNENIDNIEAEIKETTGIARRGVQIRREGLIEKRRQLLLKQPAIETKQKALLILALMIMGFAGYYWYATSPGRCGWDRTWTGLPCPRSAPVDRFCEVHEPIYKAELTRLQNVLRLKGGR